MAFTLEARVSAPVATQAAWPACALGAWHLLSLDAPTVAAAWTLLFARAGHVPLHWTVPVAMFLAVWILYAADRLLDAARTPGESSPLEARHLFHQRHARCFLLAILTSGAALLPLIAVLPRAQLRLDVGLGAALLLWFGVVHGAGTRLRPHLPKELVVGAFFGAAVCVPELASPHGNPASLLVGGLAFAAVCVLNCLWIALWEATPAHPAPVSRRGLRTAGGMLVAVPLALVHCLPQPLALGIALASALLCWLDLSRRRFSRLTLRAAADLALLTPLFVLPFCR